MSIVVIPTSYWISVVEIGSVAAGSDQEFSLSYGQVSTFCPRMSFIGVNIYPTGASGFRCCPAPFSDNQTLTPVRSLVHKSDLDQTDHWTPQKQIITGAWYHYGRSHA